MVFTTSPTGQLMPFPPLDSIPISDLLFDDKYGRCPVEKSPNPFICGLTGNSYSFKEYGQRVDLLSSVLSKDISWRLSKGAELDKVIAISGVNMVSKILGYQLLNLLVGGRVRGKNC
jgi:ribosome assembly protein SQT1